MGQKHLDPLAVLAASFVISAFAGLFAYLRTVNGSRPNIWQAMAAFGNGGCAGISVCGFIYWQSHEEPNMLFIFGAASAIGLAGAEGIQAIGKAYRAWEFRGRVEGDGTNDSSGPIKPKRRKP